MTILESILLGVIQGIFMFFPVSSTSHLVLTQHWLSQRGSALPPAESPEMIFFDLIVHVGTLISIAVVFRQSLSRFIIKVWQDTIQFLTTLTTSRREPLSLSLLGKEIRPLILPSGERGDNRYLYLRLAILGMLSVVVTALIGFPMRSLFKAVFAQPLAIALTLTITGILLWYTDYKRHQKVGLREMNPLVASIIGVGQALSLMPGLSRSGMTISFSLFAGMKRQWAAEYSFFIAFPTILGATLLQVIEVIEADAWDNIGFLPMFIGFVVSAIVGIFALYLVVILLYKAKFRFFSFYVWALAVIVAIGSFRGVFSTDFG
ncbi:undecaprenyl-diphosphate phosphatase [Euhalothece natronophila Z-M001]|uniref:Undecaprenyl-diphosphatase n=1 Tax=Euhalothece natronophila Z-M001 TaxID=522448 RepID=A0A5B8NQW3_9CHRO|nr:undecaprenyl-diphosphate phosphatase [Euhalothece natronophila]QDZ40891.1 undecaprenyl-diphosphate phosphatase [Euhalothece natronophila Z-M001]